MTTINHKHVKTASKFLISLVNHEELWIEKLHNFAEISVNNFHNMNRNGHFHNLNFAGVNFDDWQVVSADFKEVMMKCLQKLTILKLEICTCDSFWGTRNTLLTVFWSKYYVNYLLEGFFIF